MKADIMGLVVLFVFSLGYVVFRAMGYYVQNGTDIDLVVLIVGALLLSYFISQLANRKSPYLLLIVFIPIILYTGWNNADLVEAKSTENGKYLVTEKLPALCCGNNTDSKSSYIIYKKVQGPFYKKHMEFSDQPQLFMQKYGAEKPSAKEIETFFHNLRY